MTGWLILADQCVRAHEGCAKPIGGGMFKSYVDPGTGALPWTIGWGSTGPDVGRSTIWSKAQCDARMLHDLTDFGFAVDRLTGKNPTSDCQKAALVSFAYNEGAEKLGRSTLLRYHNDGNYAGAADEFLKWIYADHKPMKGLKDRRTDERKLYLGKQP